MRNILFPSSSMCFRSVYNNHNHVSVYRICLVYWELAEMCTSLPVRGLMGGEIFMRIREQNSIPKSNVIS